MFRHFKTFFGALIEISNLVSQTIGLQTLIHQPSCHPNWDAIDHVTSLQLLRQSCQVVVWGGGVHSGLRSLIARRLKKLYSLHKELAR